MDTSGNSFFCIALRFETRSPIFGSCLAFVVFLAPLFLIPSLAFLLLSSPAFPFLQAYNKRVREERCGEQKSRDGERRRCLEEVGRGTCTYIESLFGLFGTNKKIPCHHLLSALRGAGDDQTVEKE